MNVSSTTVFISYAREDAKYAEKLYHDLKNVGLNPWIDKVAIKPGEKWKIAIRRAIKNSRYFIPLFSSKSTKKIGYVQDEFHYAIENFDKFPESEIYIIPARLDECQIPFEKLEEIHHVDLFPNWASGMNQILMAMGIDINIEKDNKKEKEQWKMGLSDKDWKDLLILICKKKCIPFIGSGIYTVENEEGKKFLPSSKDVIDKWKEKHQYPLEDIYDLARVYTLEDSYQLARLATFLEIESADEMYPKNMLSDMLKEIDVSILHSTSKNISPYDVIADLDLPIYITTNYDRFLENALSKSPNKEPQTELCRWNDRLTKFIKTFEIASVFDEKQYQPLPDKPLVYHILGDIEMPQSMVLSEKDFFEFVINLNKNEEKDMIPSVIRKELGLSSLLFIGYNLDDINFRVIFQGFLSFLNALPKEYRKLSIAVQIPPMISKAEQVKMQKYMEQYTRNLFDVHIYWGNTFEFIKELYERWNNFKKENDLKICIPFRGM